MDRRLGRLGRFLAVTMLLAALLATPAFAQEKEDTPFEEPGIEYLQRRDPYIQTIAGVLIAACLLIAFKNPHRTHLN